MRPVSAGVRYRRADDVVAPRFDRVEVRYALDDTDASGEERSVNHVVRDSRAGSADAESVYRHAGHVAFDEVLRGVARRVDVLVGRTRRIAAVEDYEVASPQSPSVGLRFHRFALDFRAGSVVGEVQHDALRHHLVGSDFVQLARFLPSHYDMWKGVLTDPRSVYEYAASFEYPRSLEVARIGDRLDLESPGVIPLSSHR
nr:hypothetical protein [Halopelagius inordinatus]